MPFPQPPKTISKRFKKPKPLLRPPAACLHTLDAAMPSQKLHSLGPRELRVRVICTDPDATDDSSDDGDDDEPTLRLQRIAGKRLVREIWLPSPPSPNLHTRDMASKGESSHMMKRAQQGGVSCWRNSKLQGNQQVRSSKVHKGTMPWVEGGEEEEHLAWFLSGFTQEEGEMWDFDVDYTARPHKERSCAEMLDLELDAEVLSWIDSLQRLP